MVIPGVANKDNIDGMIRDLDRLWTTDMPIKNLTINDVRQSEGGPTQHMTHEEIIALDPAQRAQFRDWSNWRTHGFTKHSPDADAIAQDPELLRITTLIFGRRSKATSSINFMYGSRQQLHQDSAVFHIYPPHYLIGAWVAGEDISPDCGPLVYYPKSHREPMFPKFDNYPQTNLRTASKEDFQGYYDHIERVGERYERHQFLGKQGEVLLWHGMLIHGGDDVVDPELTRRSFVVHYAPPNVNFHTQMVGPFNF